MAMLRFDALLLVLIVSTVFGLWIFAMLRLWRLARYENVPISHAVTDPWLGSIFAFTMMASALLLIAGDRLSDGPPENRLPAQVRLLSEQVAALASGLERTRVLPNDGHGPSAERQIQRVERQLRHVSTRVTAVEARIARQSPRWPLPKVLVVMALGALTLGAGWVLWKNSSWWAMALVASVGLGSVASVTIEPESLVSLRVERLVTGRDSDDRPVFVVSAPGSRTEFRPAYAIPFANQSSSLERTARDAIDDLARGLQSCVQTGAGRPLRLTVTGFASSAPFYRQPREASNKSNETLAGQRSEAVVRALSRWLCQNQPCDANKVSIETRDASRTYSLMMGNQLFGDDGTADDRRRAVEFLTRSALVTVDDPGRCAAREAATD